MERKGSNEILVLILTACILLFTLALSANAEQSVISDVATTKDFKCFYCSSPLRSIKNKKVAIQLNRMMKYVLNDKLRKVMKKECAEPENATISLRTITCKRPVCMKWIITHSTSRPEFVVRTCAESLFRPRENDTEEVLKGMQTDKCQSDKKALHMEQCVCTQSLCNVASKIFDRSTAALFCGYYAILFVSFLMGRTD